MKITAIFRRIYCKTRKSLYILKLYLWVTQGKQTKKVKDDRMCTTTSIERSKSNRQPLKKQHISVSTPDFDPGNPRSWFTQENLKKQ